MTSGALATYREGSLHAALKARYAAAAPGSRIEANVANFVVDVVRLDELVEIQTTSFASARRKLEALVVAHRVVLVHPIPVEKWLVVVDADAAIVRRRRSPRQGLPLDLFDELVSMPRLIAHPNFRIEVVLTCEEEVRGPVPEGIRFRRPRTWVRLDRRLVRVADTLRIDDAVDLLRLLPPGLPDPFTTADIVTASGRSRRLAMRAAYCLAHAGAVAQVGHQGRLRSYGLGAGSSAVVG
jgi:hypothetical protein